MQLAMLLAKLESSLILGKPQILPLSMDLSDLLPTMEPTNPTGPCFRQNVFTHANEDLIDTKFD
jgi:hypothetical protein